MNKDLDCTYKIYSSDSIKFNFENNFKKVICKKPIKKKEILLVEHNFCSTKEVLEKCVSKNTNIFNELYPREKDSTSLEKVQQNCFISDNLFSLGIYDSWFNTSEKYNAGVQTMLTDISYLYIPIDISFIIALKDIEPEEEIFIYYKRKSCGIFENKEIETKYNNDIDDIIDTNIRKNMYTIMRDYILNSISLEIYLNQILIEYDISYECQSNTNTNKDKYYILQNDEINNQKIKENILKSKTTVDYYYKDINEAMECIKNLTINVAFRLIISSFNKKIQTYSHQQ